VAYARHRSRPFTAALYAVTAAGTAVLVAASASTARPAESAGPGAAVLAASSATISETGSSLLAPQAQTWATAYHRANPDVTVGITSTSSGTGISAAGKGAADIGASDAYLSSGDLVQSPTLLNIALTVSAQTVIYNLPGLSQGSHVSLDGHVLAEIYRGTIQYWDDPGITGLGANKGLSLPHLKVVPLHRSGSSGDTFLFTGYLSTQDAGWDSQIGYGTTALWPSVPGPGAAAGEASSDAMLTTCASTPGCVGYNGISYLSRALAARLGYASLQNNAGAYTLPTGPAIKASVASFVPLTPPSETISMIDGPAAGGYPIVNYEYAVVKSVQPDAAKASALRAFLRWVITTGNGPSYLSDLGFQPLSGPLVTLGEQQVAEIGS
jgi:phosphate transport system substrate-binding protein